MFKSSVMKYFCLLAVLVFFSGCSQPEEAKKENVLIEEQAEDIKKEVLMEEIDDVVETMDEIEEKSDELALKKITKIDGPMAMIKGVVRFDGEVPNLRPIKMDADPICLSHHSDKVLPQILVLGENKTMGNIFVQIKKGLPQKKYAPPSEPAVLDQKGCMYDPHVLAVMVGQPVKVLNPDGTLHNVHSLSEKNKSFNIAMPKFRKEMTVTFDKAEFMFGMKCDVHPWMGAWVTVMDHPYFDTTQKDGLYEISDLPPGTYEIEAWHEKLGTKTETVTLEAGDVAEIDFVFSR